MAFAAFTLSELSVRAELLKAHYKNMENAHILYHQCALLSSNEPYIEATHNYVETLSKMECRIRQLDREDRAHTQPLANSTMPATEQPTFRTKSTQRPQSSNCKDNAAGGVGSREVFLAEVNHKSEREMINDMQGQLNTLSNNRRQLQAMMTQQVLEEQKFIHAATTRMSPGARDEWKRYQGHEENGGPTSIDELNQFLQHGARVHTQPARTKLGQKSTNDRGERSNHDDASKCNSNYRSRPYDRQKSTVECSRRESHGFGPPPACVMTKCNLVHYLGQCAEYRRLTFADRLAVVRDHKLCRCCLMSGHMAATCKKRGCSNCPEVKNKHHFHLCPKNTQAGAGQGKTSKITPRQ